MSLFVLINLRTYDMVEVAKNIFEDRGYHTWDVTDKKTIEAAPPGDHWAIYGDSCTGVAFLKHYSFVEEVQLILARNTYVVITTHEDIPKLTLITETLCGNPPQTARDLEEIVTAALKHPIDRAKTYDQEGGERSAGRVATAFNAVTGHAIKASEVYLMLQLLKDVRQWSNPTDYHQDSAEDSIVYAALKAEALEIEAFGSQTKSLVPGEGAVFAGTENNLK